MTTESVKILEDEVIHHCSSCERAYRLDKVLSEGKNKGLIFLLGLSQNEDAKACTNCCHSKQAQNQLALSQAIGVVGEDGLKDMWILRIHADPRKDATYARIKKEHDGGQ